MIIDDRRTNEQKKSTTVFVSATDTFMSGWGRAKGTKSYFCVACENTTQVARTRQWLQGRDEMHRVMVTRKPRKAQGSHTSVIMFAECGAGHDRDRLDWWREHHLHFVAARALENITNTPTLAHLAAATDSLEKLRRALVRDGITLDTLRTLYKYDLDTVRVMWLALDGPASELP